MDLNKLFASLLSSSKYPVDRSYHISSGNKEIDRVINEIQCKYMAKYQNQWSSSFYRNRNMVICPRIRCEKYFQWFPYEELKFINEIGKGGFGTVYHVLNNDSFDYALKSLKGSRKSSKGFVESVNKKSIILGIAYGVKAIHDEDKETGDHQTYISDLGVCNPVDERHTRKLYGVLPFVAPEVLKGSEYTKESDIYSLAMLIWTVIMGRKPYSDCSHDIYLTLEICSGLRPEIPEGTPYALTDLIMQCWDSDPTKRPNIHEIILILNWVPFSEGGFIGSGVDSIPQHQEAIYTSHLLYSYDEGSEFGELIEEYVRKSREKEIEEDPEDFVEIVNLNGFVEGKTVPRI
ncbi:2149_t:CDS:2 [Acaulospora morrowiae]|uniref:2149_t:CDS:1 n=1 Tax=Acaulospora morrowiae TaxID=94023 RepID=A0A9N9B5Y3_9GLOM|nr:2149_t:CDS:2 [Acaulospora morrowiae]